MRAVGGGGKLALGLQYLQFRVNQEKQDFMFDIQTMNSLHRTH